MRRRSVVAKRTARAPAGGGAQVNPDAYAQLLRAVGGDAAMVERLLAYEIKRGASPSDAAQAALERLQRDRARSA
ncbi:hypothetical protein EGI20_16575 [Aquitalea sp. S1-19]|nr:hypothetical protein [Aquitalea sp. S1-19]